MLKLKFQNQGEFSSWKKVIFASAKTVSVTNSVLGNSYVLGIQNKN